MVKFLLGLCILFSVGIANSQNTLDPVSNVVARIKSPNNTSDIAYVGMRCSALYGYVAAYFEMNGNASDAPTIADLRRQANGFQKVALTLNLGVNKMSSDAIQKQGSVLTKYYAAAMSEGKRLNNNAFTPFIQSDLAACKVESDGYSQLASSIK